MFKAYEEDPRPVRGYKGAGRKKTDFKPLLDQIKKDNVWYVIGEWNGQGTARNRLTTMDKIPGYDFEARGFNRTTSKLYARRNTSGTRTIVSKQA